MSDEQELIEFLRLNPGAREPHLVMADWLSERGDPRGELAAIHDRIMEAHRTKDQAAQDSLLPLAHVLIEANLSRWLGFDLSVREVTIDELGDLRVVTNELPVMLRWGFVSGVESNVYRLSEIWGRPETLLRRFLVRGAGRGELARLLRNRYERDRAAIVSAGCSSRSLLGSDDVDALSELPELRALSLVESRIVDRAPPILPVLPHLRYLRLDHCPWLGDAMLAPLAEMRSLRHLSLFGCTALEGGFLEPLPFLETLALGRVELDDEAFERLLRLRQLRRLDLSETTLSNARLRAIVEAMPKLKRLSLTRARGISPDGFLSLLDLPHLERVAVAGTPFRFSQRFSQRSFEGVVSFAPAREPFDPPPDVLRERA